MAKVTKKKPLGRGLSSLLGENIDVDNLTNTKTKKKRTACSSFKILYLGMTHIY